MYCSSINARLGMVCDSGVPDLVPTQQAARCQAQCSASMGLRVKVWHGMVLWLVKGSLGLASWM